jgi:hypothetical protein
MSKVTVSEDFGGSGDVTCPQCGETFHLFFNGGELDWHTCRCGRSWETRHTKIQLVYRVGGEDNDEN